MATKEKQIWDFFIAQGLTPVYAAAFMGNLWYESGQNLEYGSTCKEGAGNGNSAASINYTNRVNVGYKDPNSGISEHTFVYDGIGYGLAQWTYYSRKQGLYNFTVKQNVSIGDLNCQLKYLVTESEYKSTISALNALPANERQDVRTCTYTVCDVFENPDPQAFKDSIGLRQAQAENIYKKYVGLAPSSNNGSNSSGSSNSSLPNKTRPVIYYQTDPQWANHPFPHYTDTTTTISSSACGPTCAAMVIATISDASVTPVTTADYAEENGYRYYCDSGVNYPGFYEAIMAKYSINITCTSSDDAALKAIGEGKMVIVNVGPAGGQIWTRNGHYILAYGLADNGKTVLINDPNNYGEKSSAKSNGDINAFKSAAAGGPYVIINTPWTSAVPSNSAATNAMGNTSGGAASSATAASAINYHIEYQEVSAEVKTSTIYTADADANAQRTRANNLLTTPTLVESPFIWLTIGDYTFGSYSIEGSYERNNSRVTINYPNYMNSIKINKVNGQVNQYQITMIYQIRNGDDPNLLDKIFSSVGYGKVHISYGDWNAPKFIYQDEEAIITKLSTNVDFANSRITYTLNCTSNALVLMSNYTSEKADVIKPSQRIFEMMYREESKYGLQKVFTAFANNEAFFWKCVAADDVAVEVNAKTLIDPLSYINYLVTCMSPTTTPKNSPLRDANYYLTIREDKELGTYFTIKKVSSSEGIISLNNSDVYEVDVGYPGDTLVTSFKINNENSWSLLYNYAENINTGEYSYNIDSEGNIYSTNSPSLTMSNQYLKTTETQRNWWTQMTQFPVTATLTIKGLLRPAMLMSYVRVNALFYGLRHVSSGLYIITKQVDTIDASGYRTTLSLTRVAGDLDAIITDTKTVTTLVPVYVMD